MHVAYIHQHFSTRQGFTGTRSYEMSRCLLAHGHRVSMICGSTESAGTLGSAGQRVTRREIDGIEVYCVNEPYTNKFGFYRRLLAFQRFAAEARRVVVGLRADLVFATSTPLTVGIPGMKGARALGVPFVFEVRDLWPELPIALGVLKNPLLKWYARRMERRIYFAARHVIALAPGIKDGICKTGYPSGQVTMIPNAADLELFRADDAPLLDERFGPASDLRLVFTGAHGVANGLDAVLDAAAELKRRGERGVRFVFIGDGRERARLVERSQRDGLDALITWCKFMPKDELAALLPRMDVGLMILKNVPGFYYGTSPNKFFDYIGSGIPVLNNYPGWLAGMIKEHACGLVVPPDDARALADAVVWLRDHRDELQEMGRRSRRLAESQFSRAKLAETFVKTLERVAGHTGAVGPARVEVRAMRPGDAGAVARYHQQGIPTGVLAELGPGFLTALYQAIAGSPSGFVFVAVDERERVLGFICGTTDMRAIFRRVIWSNFWRFGPRLARHVLSVRMLRRIIDALRYPSKMGPDLPAAELLSIVVDAGVRGGGASGLLMRALLDEFRARGVARVRVMVGADLPRANAYYQKHGFGLATTIQSHGRTANVYVIDTGAA